MSEGPLSPTPTAQPLALRWTLRALVDLARLHGELAPARPQVADQALRTVVRAVGRLTECAYAGDSLPAFSPRDVRRLVIGRYELRYEVCADGISVLRLWRGFADR